MVLYDPNLYLYVRNSPTDLVGPLGLWLRPYRPVATPLAPLIVCPVCNQFGMGAGEVRLSADAHQADWLGSPFAVDSFADPNLNCECDESGYLEKRMPTSLVAS